MQEVSGFRPPPNHTTGVTNENSEVMQDDPRSHVGPSEWGAGVTNENSEVMQGEDCRVPVTPADAGVTNENSEAR